LNIILLLNYKDIFLKSKEMFYWKFKGISQSPHYKKWHQWQECLVVCALNLLVILLLFRLAPKIQIGDDKSTVIFLCKCEKNQLGMTRENHCLITFLFRIFLPRRTSNNSVNKMTSKLNDEFNNIYFKDFFPKLYYFSTSVQW
jgi:hypothetical protein